MMPQLHPTQCSALCPTRATSLGPSPRLKRLFKAVPTLTSSAAELLSPAPCTNDKLSGYVHIPEGQGGGAFRTNIVHIVG